MSTSSEIDYIAADAKMKHLVTIKGESILAFIVVAENQPFNLIELKKYLSDRTASFKLPRKIIIRESLPKNATGKIMKKLLKEAFL